MKFLAFVSTLLSLFVGSLFAEEGGKKVEEKSPYGEISGQIRMYHVFEPAYIDSNPTKYDIDASAIGAKLKYTTPTWMNIGLSTAAYHVRELHNNNLNSDTIVGAGRFLTDDLSPKIISTENQIFYKSKTNKLTIGQQIYDSPMTKEIVTFVPNIFMGTSFTNTYAEKSSVTISHLNGMAPGSRFPVEFGLIGEGTNTAGATQNALEANTVTNRGEFTSVEVVALGSGAVNTKGIVVLGVDHQFNKTNSIRVWNYYADDIMNMLYVEIEHKWKVDSLGLKFNAQYLREDQTGDKLASITFATGLPNVSNFDKLSANLYGAKLSFNYKDLKGFIGYNHTSDSKIFNPWGGDPAYTSSFFSRNAYRKNVDAYKLTLNYTLNDKNNIIFHYADYGTSDTLGSLLTVEVKDAPVDLTLKEATEKAIETAILLSYKPTDQWHIFTGFIYKTSEYAVNNEVVKIFDADLVVTYKF